MGGVAGPLLMKYETWVRSLGNQPSLRTPQVRTDVERAMWSEPAVPPDGGVVPMASPGCAPLDGPPQQRFPKRAAPPETDETGSEDGAAPRRACPELPPPPPLNPGGPTFMPQV